MDGCSLANGAKFSIFSCVFYIAAALCIIILPRPEPYLDTVLGARTGNKQRTRHRYSRVSSKPILPDEEAAKCTVKEDFDEEQGAHSHPQPKEAEAVSVVATSSKENINNEQVPLVLTAPMTYDSEEDDEIEEGKRRAVIDIDNTQSIIRNRELEFHTDSDEPDMNQLYNEPVNSSGFTSHMGEDSDNEVESPKEQESQQEFRIDIDSFVLVDRSDGDSKSVMSELEQGSVSRQADVSRAGPSTSTNLDDDDAFSDAPSDIASEASIEISLEQAASIAESEKASLLPPMEPNTMEPEPILYLPSKDDSDKTKSSSTDANTQLADISGKTQTEEKGKSTGFWSLWWKPENSCQKGKNDVATKDSRIEEDSNVAVNENKVGLFVDSTMVGMVDHSPSRMLKEEKTTKEDDVLGKEPLPEECSKSVEGGDLADLENKVALFVDSFMVGIVDHKPTQVAQAGGAMSEATSAEEVQRSNLKGISNDCPDDGDSTAATVWPVVEPTSQTTEYSSEQNEVAVSSSDVLILHAIPEQDDESRSAITRQSSAENSENEALASSCAVLGELPTTSPKNLAAASVEGNENEEEGQVSVCAKGDQTSSNDQNLKANVESLVMSFRKTSEGENSEQISDLGETQKESKQDSVNWPVFTKIPPSPNSKGVPTTLDDSVDDDTPNENFAASTKRDRETAMRPETQENDSESTSHLPKKTRFHLQRRSSQTSAEEALTFDSANKIDTAAAISAELNATNTNTDETYTEDDKQDSSNMTEEAVNQRQQSETTTHSKASQMIDDVGGNSSLEPGLRDEGNIAPTTSDTEVQSSKITHYQEADNLSAPSDEMNNDDDATISTNQSSDGEEEDQAGTIIQDMIDIVQDAYAQGVGDSLQPPISIDDICGGEQKEQSGCESEPDVALAEPTDAAGPGCDSNEKSNIHNQDHLKDHEGTDPATGDIQDQVKITRGSESTNFDGAKLNQAESDAEVLSVATLSTDDSTAHGSAGFGSPKSKGSVDPASPSTSQLTAEVSQKSTGLDGQRVKTSSNTESLSGLCEF